MNICLPWLQRIGVVAIVCLLVPPNMLLGAELRSTITEVENHRPGTSEWRLKHPALHHEIEGYASRTSVNRGESIDLFVHTAAPAYDVLIFRMGWYAGQGGRLMAGPYRYQGHQQSMPLPDPISGLIECQWENPITVNIPTDVQDPSNWPSGIYLVKLIAWPSEHDSYIIFVVRDDERSTDLLIQSSVTTFQAYNNWGGKSLYEFNSKGGAATKVSFNRPYALSHLLQSESGIGTGDFLTGWEYNMVRWLEEKGYDVSYTTNVDIHERGDLLLRHRAFLSVGHDEYWSWYMRDHVEAARDHGVHLGFFSANTCYWQIRLEPSLVTYEADRTMTAYKYRARWLDPYSRDSDPLNDYLITTQWRSPPVSRPESHLIGVMYFFDPVNSDLVVNNATHWITENTGLQTGDHLPGLLGYEVDSEDPTNPYQLEVITRSPAGSGWAASTVYTAPSGSLVFATGSMQWIWGLDDFNAPALRPARRHQAVERMTENILRRFIEPLTLN